MNQINLHVHLKFFALNVYFNSDSKHIIYYLVITFRPPKFKEFSAVKRQICILLSKRTISATVD